MAVCALIDWRASADGEADCVHASRLLLLPQRRWQEITIFVLPLLFSCIPMAVLLVGGVDSFEEFHP